MLRIPHCLDNRLTVNFEILATCSSTYSPVRTSQEERERERERKWWGSERHTRRGGGGNNNFRFEGSQALPANPSDKGKA
jgi:hypothetical protein